MEETEKTTLTWTDRLKKGFSILGKSVKNSSEIAYLILLGVYVTFFFLKKVNLDSRYTKEVTIALSVCLSVTMWCAALYLFYAVAEGFKLWKKTLLLLGVGAVIGGGAFLFGSSMSGDAFNWGMDIYFCLMAYGKNYKRILRTVLIAVVITLIVAAIGIPLGYSHDRPKPENVSPGHSLGIIYPNTWGYITFLGMLICWYLYLQKKPLLTLLLFWGMTLVMYFYISCRTVAVLTLGFPFLAVFVWWLDKRPSQNTAQEDRKMNLAGALLTALPILCFALTVILGLNMEWVHKQFYHTRLRTMAMRFVQSGICFKVYGFPIIGHDIMTNYSIISILNGEPEYLYVMDNSYGSYTIMRGMIWMTACLVWLTLAMYKAWKKRDNALLVCGVFLCVFALMERPGLDLWYNFLLAYPLAAVGAPKKLNWKFWEKKPAEAAQPENAQAPEDENIAQAAQPLPEAQPAADNPE